MTFMKEDKKLWQWKFEKKIEKNKFFYMLSFSIYIISKNNNNIFFEIYCILKFFHRKNIIIKLIKF